VVDAARANTADEVAMGHEQLEEMRPGHPLARRRAPSVHGSRMVFRSQVAQGMSSVTAAA
jgi:hypothetical protein